MSQVSLLQRGYSRAMKRDVSRDQMPTGALWDLVDYIPNVIGSPLRKRGGWEDGSAPFGAGAYAATCAFADFTTGNRLVAINDNGTLYSIAPATGAATSEGAAQIPVGPLVLHRDVLIIPSPDGTTSVKKYLAAGGAPAALAATAPAGMHATSYKDRAILANIAGEPQRVFFGPGGDPTQVWDTAESYIDMNLPEITGLVALRNVILVFGSGRTERIRGTTPPPNTDMAREPLFNTGCIDARSIVPYGDNVIFANQEGIWMTDGSVPENLAESCGFLSFWIDLLDAWSSAWTLAAGFHRGLYLISVMDGTTFLDAIAIDINDRSWFRVSNLKARMFTRAVGASEELYMARRDTAQLARLSPIFNPSSANQHDADGAAVLPVLETPFYTDSPTLKRWHEAYLHYLLTSPSEEAELELSYITTPEATSYTVLSSFSELAALDRKRAPLRFKARGIAFRLRQTAASADTRIHELEADVHALEASR